MTFSPDWRNYSQDFLGDCRGGVGGRQLLQELRRGMTRADVLCIAFHPFSNFIACSSDQGTIHVFALDPKISGVSANNNNNNNKNSNKNNNTPQDLSFMKQQGLMRKDADTNRSGISNNNSGRNVSTGDTNQKSTLSFMKGMLPKYFSSEWSFAQFRIPATRTICAFGTEPTDGEGGAAGGRRRYWS